MREREQGLSEENLISDDGTLNTEAIDKRAGEIDALAAIWAAIKRRREDMRKIAQRVARTYETIVTRLGIARTYAMEPRYTAIGEQLGRQREALRTWRERVRELGFTVQEDDISLTALRNEARGIRGTRPTAEPPTALDFIQAQIAQAGLTPDEADDRAAAAELQAFRQTEYEAAVASGDPRRIAEAAGNLASVNQGAGQFSAQSLATAAREQLGAFTQAREQLFSTFGSNFVAQPLVGRAFADQTQQAAGLRNFGTFGASDAQTAGFSPLGGVPAGGSAW